MKLSRVAALVFAVTISAHAADTPTIRDAATFWSMPDPEKQQVYPLRLEMIVTYYDAGWKLLWGESGGHPFYLPLADGDLRLKAGQRVLLEGTVVPAVGLSSERTRVTVLAERALPAPWTLDRADPQGDGWEARWVRVDGYVCRQVEVDPTHVLLSILIGGRIVAARVPLGSTESIPQLLGMQVRARGVYVSTRDPSGELQRADLWVPHTGEIEVHGSLGEDARFRLPLTPIENLRAQPGDKWVRIAGEVRSREPDRALTLRDETGQVVILTQQPGSLQRGDMVEVIGRPAGEGLEMTLRNPVFRLAPSGQPAESAGAGSGESVLHKLRLIEQVMELRPEEAVRRYPVFLKGVVTWVDAAAGFYFIQDSSGGIRVRAAAAPGRMPEIGAMLAVKGVSAQGAFAPEVEAREVTHLGWMILPVPRQVTLEQAMTGADEGRRVEIRGYLRQVVREGAWLRLDLTTSGGEFAAYALPDAGHDAHVGAVVRVAGVCVASANAQRQLTGIRLWLAGADSVQVEQPAPVDPFAAPERTIASLRQFVTNNVIGRRVRIAGCVLHQHRGRFVYLQDGDAGLLVLSREMAQLAPGEWIEAVGFPGREGSRLVLREAIWRRRPAGPQPQPLVLGEGNALDREADGRLVRLRARLHQTIPESDGARLVLSAGSGTFEAHLDDSPAIGFRDGSVLELTGVYSLEFDEYRRPRAFQLHLRSREDVRLIAAPSWWTAQRALAIAGGFGLCTLLGTIWVTVLRRRVNQQTQQIREQLEKESRLQAELERTTRLESLGVLAGGIAHDFNNLLTVVLANLSLARLDRLVETAAGDMLGEAERGAKRAAELTQQLLTFAKGGDPVRKAVSLPEVVREAANFALHGSNVRCEFSVASELPPANVDRAQIGRVVHNLVLNATQAMPSGGVIRISLASTEVEAGELPTLAAGRYLKLSVADNGPGIAPEHVARIFDPYFSTKPKNSGLGLATVHSIVKKHQGHVIVDSAPGAGCTFHIWLPVSEAMPDSSSSGSNDVFGHSRARVLFMDDDETIRLSATAMLRELGHDARVVADGADAIAVYREAKSSSRPFDVVVLDLTVPGGMGGKAAMQELREFDPAVKAIVSSGYSSDPVMAHHRSYGFMAAVPKPYGIADLGRAIEELLRHARRERAHGRREATVAQKA